jgi:RNA polymerase sigma-70 factor (ECF subfamily)
MEDVDADFPAFVTQHAGLVWTVLIRGCGLPLHDADDCAQETFIRAYEALRRYPVQRRRELQARPWLTTIALNIVRNTERSRKRRAEVPLPDDIITLASDDVGATLDSADLTDRLAGLAERYRVPIVLRHVHGMSYAEIAAVLELPSGTVKAQVSRGLALLRENLRTEVSA